MSPTRRSSAPERVDLFEQVREELSRALEKPNILAFRPYPKQKAILDSSAPGRYVSGGNRAGKTTTEVVDAIWTATDTHPFRKRPDHWGHGAVRIRFVVVDIIKGVYGIILPELKRWIATSMLVDGSWDKSWDDRELKLSFSNGSTITFLTHGMDLDKHGGVPLHAIYFDEEPPQDVFNENMMRLIDYDGHWLIAATSTQGIGWTYDLLVEPAKEHPNDPDIGIEVFELSQYDNPNLASKREARNRFYVGMSSTDREIREDGKMTARQGYLFPQFGLQPEKFILDEVDWVPGHEWTFWTSADFGFHNPTAWLWHAVAPDGRIVTFAEHYQSEITVPEHAAIVHQREQQMRIVVENRTGDPAGNQRQGNTGTSYITEYGKRGLYIGTESLPRGDGSVEIGVQKMQQYFRILPISPWGPMRPTWQVSPSCPNLIRELKKLRWDAPESQRLAYRTNGREGIYKKDDHASDSLRYFMTLLPDLRPVVEEPKRGHHDGLVSYEDLLVRIANDENSQYVYDHSIDPGWQTQSYIEDEQEYLA